MEIATPARSSPFPKLTFDHKLIIAKHLVSTNVDDKRKTPNHLNGGDECSTTCDLKDDVNYENGAKSRLNDSNITGGIVISNEKTPTTVGDKPIIGVQQQQRQDDMPTKMSENHHHQLIHLQQQQQQVHNANDVATSAIRINGEDLCNNINRDNTLTTTNTNKLPYDAYKSLDDRIKTITSVTVHGDDELTFKSNQQQLNCNSNKSDLRNNANNINHHHHQNDYNENCKNDTNCNGGGSNTFNNEGHITSSGNNGIAFKVPTELAINNLNSGNYNNRSSPSSPSVPYRKQSVFVAPAGLNWIIHKNRNNPQHQPQPSQQHQISSNKQTDPSGLSTPSTPSTTTFTSSKAPIVSTPLPFNSSPSSLPSTVSPTTTTTSSTILSPSTVGVNGEIFSNNNSSSSSIVNCSNNNNISSNNSSTFIRKNSTSSLQPNANAQEIGQHINKIISENAAIVETLDPLWSKRYHSRHSVSSLPSSGSSSSYPANLTGSIVTTNNLPSRRYSEIVVDPNHASASKLQSALLGRVLTTCSTTSSTTVVSPSNVPHLAHHPHQQHRLPVNPNGPTKKFSEPTYPSVIINMKQHQQQQQVNSLTNKTGAGGSTVINDQTGLRPSLVRNLLTSAKSSSTIKVIPVPTSSSSSSSTTTIVDNNSTSNVNPDNPEGSIIKDLLLKARDSGESLSESRRSSRVQMPSIPPPIQEELSMLVYVCTLCTICFRNKETLEAHQLHYCKANETQSTINERSPNQLQLLNDHVQRKISVMESNFLQQQLTKPVQSSSGSNLKSGNIFTQPQLVNQQQHQLKQQQHHYQSSSSSPHNQTTQQQQQPSVGNILKQQLLAPSAGPPQKKRKTSEPLFTKSHLHRFSHPNHPLNHHSQSQYHHHGEIINSHGVRKTSVVQGPSSSKLLLLPKTKSNSKETLIESDCLNSSLSSSLSSTTTTTTPSSSSSPSSSTSSSTMINDNLVISVTSEPITFSSSNTIASQSIAFSSSNHSHSFYNQSSLDRLSSTTLSSSSSSTTPPPLPSTANQKSPLDILPDYYPHLKCPKTKVTLSGPIVFPVLRKILTENKENIEFQASPESFQSPPSTSSSSSSSSLSTINPSGHANNDTINNSNNYLVYKQIPSISEFDEDSSMVEVKVDEDNLKDDKLKVEQVDDDEPIKCDNDDNLNILPVKLAHHHQEVIPTLTKNQEGQDNKFDGQSNVCINEVDNQDKERKQLTQDYDDNKLINSDSTNCDSKLINIANGLINNRPTTLTLRKKYSSSEQPSTQSTTGLMENDNKLIGSTLVSPDTPRPKRKCMQLYIKGQTYTYLGLKMSTRSTYCCIYRPQPMYVPQEASSKLSMYSNWKINPPHHDIFKLMSPAELLHAYDTRQWCFKVNGISITFAPSLESKKSLADSFILTPSSSWTIKKQRDEKAAIKRELIELKRKGIEDLTDPTPMDSNNNQTINNIKNIYLVGGGGSGSRKTSEDRLSTMSGFDSDSNDPNQPKRVKIFEGGFKSNEDYTYVRGRGRGKYVCEECGIRCKKPSMLKKHIRTHTDLRPYSCRHCAFAFKTKGNLTKHMKSKAHHKKCVELGIIPVPITIDESQIDCEALAKQEALERSYSGGHLASDDDENDPDDEDGCEEEEDDGSDDEGVPIPIITSSGNLTDRVKMDIDEQEVARSLLVLSGSGEWSVQGGGGGGGAGGNPTAAVAATASASGVQVAPNCLEANYNCDNRLASSPSKQQQVLLQQHQQVQHHQHITDTPSDLRKLSTSSSSSLSLSSSGSSHSSSTGVAPTIVNGAHFTNHSSSNIHNSRQRSFSFNDGLIRRNPLMMTNNLHNNLRRFEKQQQQSQSASLDLSNCNLASNSNNDNSNNNQPINGHINGGMGNDNGHTCGGQVFEHITTDDSNDSEVEDHFQRRYSMSVIQDRVEPMYFNYDGPIDLSRRPNEDPDNPVAGPSRYDQAPTGRRNTFSTPSSHPLRHLSRAELAAAINGSAASSFGIGTREDGKSVCLKCNKSFPKLSQLRLHVNVHYFERPFRCDSCSVSFRTKGHLQKHEKSVTHSDKVKINLAFGAPTTDNPRPFKCDDCVIAFRIHGHLAKHLRSKNHIMKLECAGKLPCGMYADMERFGINLNVIETADCESSLISLQRLADQMYNTNGEVNLTWVRHAAPPTTSSNSNQNDPNTVTVTSATLMMTSPNATTIQSPSSATSNSTTITTGGQLPPPPNHSPDATCSIPTASTTAITTTVNNNIYYHNLNLTNCNNNTMDVDVNNHQIIDTNCANNTIMIDNIGDNNNNNMVNDNNNNHYTYHNHVGHMGNMLTVNSLQGSPSSPPPPSQPQSQPPPTPSNGLSSSPSTNSSSSPSSSSTTPPSTITTATTSSTTNITSIRSNTCNYCKQVFKSAKFLQVHLYCDHQQRSSSPALTTDPNPQQPQQPHHPPQPSPPQSSSLPTLLSHQSSSHSTTSTPQLQQPSPLFQPMQIHPHQHLQQQYHQLQPQFHHPLHQELHQQHLQHLQQLQQLQQQIHPHPHHHLHHQQRPETPDANDI